MKKISKTLTIIIALCLCIVTLAACNNKSEEVTATPTVDPSITPAPTEPPADIDADTVDYITEQWIAVEMTFESATEYSKPFDEADFDVTFTAPDGTTVMKMPGFWDGGNTWKVRFAPTMCGVWTYTTSCTDTENTSLNGQTGKLGCNAYKGELEIYQRGFVTVQDGNRYFTYADGTPFFYLGDTHWSIAKEQFDKSGVDGIDSQFKYIVDKRVEQGFTVYQSEPIGYKYQFSNGVTKADISGLQDMDARFQYIASKGMVHANAEFFFASEITQKKYTADYLTKLARLWVARYGAYPVMWTTAQEVDNDFYYDRGDQTSFTAETNPWKLVAEKIHEYDPYNHPLTAHQEYASMDAEHGANATKSSFRDVSGHNWYAIQWTPPNNALIPFDLLKDFWENGQGKPLVNYEGSYEYLWTLEKGAREQGWTAFLNGMCGQGYGAIDIWLYNSTYDMKEDSVRGDFTITVEMKKTKWYDSVNFATATQLGHYMQDFLKSVEWWKLEPSFDDKTAEHFSFHSSAFYSGAYIGNDTYVAYFYNKTLDTCKVVNLEAGKTYTAKWFNPRTGEYTTIATDVTGINEKSYWQVPNKPDAEDWVILVTKNK